MQQNTSSKSITIALDFDGTCVTHEYPDIGADIGAESVLKELIANGHKLILDTMRSGKDLLEAVNWFNQRQITLYSVSKHPTQENWTSSPKCYAKMSIDDRNLGVPLVIPTVGDRPYVNWPAVRMLLVKQGYIE